MREFLIGSAAYIIFGILFASTCYVYDLLGEPKTYNNGHEDENYDLDSDDIMVILFLVFWPITLVCLILYYVGEHWISWLKKVKSRRNRRYD